MSIAILVRPLPRRAPNQERVKTQSRKRGLLTPLRGLSKLLISTHFPELPQSKSVES
jgi:hypothetical protein